MFPAREEMGTPLNIPGQDGFERHIIEIISSLSRKIYIKLYDLNLEKTLHLHFSFLCQIQKNAFLKLFSKFRGEGLTFPQRIICMYKKLLLQLFRLVFGQTRLHRGEFCSPLSSKRNALPSVVHATCASITCRLRCSCANVRGTKKREKSRMNIFVGIYGREKRRSEKYISICKREELKDEKNSYIILCMSP